MVGCAPTSAPTASDGAGTVQTTTPAAPASASATTTAAAASFPLSFKNADGTVTEIPAAPKRIASTSVSVTGSLLSFDAPVVASGAAGNGKFFAQWAKNAEDAGVATLWPAGKVDLEALIAQQPDLIVVSTSGQDSAIDNVPDFQKIAPTVVVDYGSQSWQDLTRQLASAVGKTAQAEAVIAKYEQRLADVKQQITVPTGKVNIVSYNGPGENNPIGRASGPHAEILQALGFEIEDPDVAWSTNGSPRGDFVFAAYETLTKLTAETTFILSKDNDGAQQFANDAVLANLPSVQHKQVYGLGKNSFRVDYFSANEIVDSVLENFAR